jgi:hypothetical protein
MKGISINEPCSENWNNMNQTERGAFCQKCSVDVYDFSRMNLNEIKSVLLQNSGQHVCGRFEKNQLESINMEFDAWKQNHPKTFQSKFILALILVFGLSLFSCNEEDKQKIAALNTTELHASLTENENRIADQLFFHHDSIITNEMVNSLEIENKLHSLQNETFIMGDIAYQEELIQTERISYTLGGPMVSAEYIDYLQETIDTSTRSTLAEPVVNNYLPFSTRLFPNPTQNTSSFSIYIYHPGQFHIELYSITGQLVDVIHNGSLSEGQNTFVIDLIEQNPGMYFIKVWSEQQQETVKIIKTE